MIKCETDLAISICMHLQQVTYSLEYKKITLIDIFHNDLTLREVLVAVRLLDVRRDQITRRNRYSIQLKKKNP